MEKIINYATMIKSLLFAALMGWAIFPVNPCNAQGTTATTGGKESIASQYASQALFVNGEGADQYAIPSLVTTNKGTLIAVCDARVDKPGDAPNNIDLVMRRSLDNGKTWSAQKTIVNFPGKDAAADASMVVDKRTGIIWLTYDYAEADPQGQLGRIIRIHIIHSTDDGLTWSAPQKLDYLTRGKTFWLQNAPGRGLYTEGGALVFPMYSIVGDFNHPSRKETVLIYSKDQGKTWVMSNGVGDNNVEAQLANISGGRILCNMRRPDGEGYRQISTTGDLGRTWSTVYTDSTLIEPGCEGSLIDWNHQGKSLILFSNPADKKARQNLVLHVSDNEGKTWQKKLSVHPGWAAYSCMTQLPNGNIGMLYEIDHRRSMLFIEIPFQDLF